MSLLDARSKFLGAKLTFPLTEINDSPSATVPNWWKTSFAWYCSLVFARAMFNEAVYCLLKRTDIIVVDFMEIQQSVLLLRFRIPSFTYSFFPFFFFFPLPPHMYYFAMYVFAVKNRWMAATRQIRTVDFSFFRLSHLLRGYRINVCYNYFTRHLSN